MEFWEDSNDKLATLFHVLSYIDFQGICVPKKVLEWILVYFVIVISMVPENRSKFSRFPKKPLGRIVHSICFSHDSVLSIKCIWQKANGTIIGKKE